MKNADPAANRELTRAGGNPDAGRHVGTNPVSVSALAIYRKPRIHSGDIGVFSGLIFPPNVPRHRDSEDNVFVRPDAEYLKRLMSGFWDVT